MSTTADNIQRQITENPILIYMKRTPQLPQSGFSAQTVQALMSCGERFAFVNVLDNPDIRAELPKIANWPTFPQLWVEGELVGGCDIVMEMRAEPDWAAKITQDFQLFGVDKIDAAGITVAGRTHGCAPLSSATRRTSRLW